MGTDTNVYFRKWVENIKSQRDIPRTTIIAPYLKQCTKDLEENCSILDIGCGWGEVIKELKLSHNYTGIDSNIHLLKYTRRLYSSQKVHLINVKYPHVELKQKYDCIFLSMVLHYIPDIEKALKKTVSSADKNSIINIITFSDKSQHYLKGSFTKITKETELFIRGNIKLPSSIILNNQTIYFHKERCIEKILSKKNRNIQKKYLGNLFVAYKT